MALISTLKNYLMLKKVFYLVFNDDLVDSKLYRFGGTYTKIGTIQRRLAWPLRKDDTQNREAFHIFCQITPIE